MKFSNRLVFSFQCLTLIAAQTSYSEETEAQLIKRLEAEVASMKGKKTEKPKTVAPTANSANSNRAILKVKTDHGCFTVSFESEPGEILSCTEPLDVDYSRTNCVDKKILERGSAEAKVECPDEKRMVLKFDTTQGPLETTLRIHREASGKSGTLTQYQVENAQIAAAEKGKDLTPPALKSTNTNESKPEESPLKFTANGYAHIEYERTSHYGYDQGTTSQTAQPNFRRDAGQPTQGNFSLFSNVNFEVSKDQTSLVSIFELGEIYYGNSGSGGAQGARSIILELRNFYLTHNFSDALNAKGGLIATASDPRSFIFNDHIGSTQLNYKTPFSEGLIWWGIGQQNLTGATKARDTYVGFLGSLGFITAFKANVFSVWRSKAEDLYALDTFKNNTYYTASGNTNNVWAGTTLEWEPKPLGAQITGIMNFNRTALAGADYNYDAWLADAKVTYNWEAPQITFTFEGLATPGGQGVTVSTNGDTTAVSRQDIRKKKNFVSPIGAAYLMNIATSDGADDAPGTPKQSVIANLNFDEGLRVGIFSTTFNFSKRLTGYFRYGFFQSEKKNATTQSTILGHEGDFGAVYQLTPSSLVQLDYGRFFPGQFYQTHTPADLAAVKYRFNF